VGDSDPLLVSRDGGVVWATLNRPERRNALSITLFHRLRELFEEVAGRPEDRVLVLQGAGGTFCSGGDLTPEPGEPLPRLGSVAASALTSLRRDVGRTALALHSLEKPTLACVEGTAAGAGANLAFGCDLTYASRGARFGELFAQRGMTLDFGGSWLLPRLVGLKKAKELALFGDWLEAEEAARLGLVNQVFEPEALVEAVRERALRLARKAPLALSVIAKALDRAGGCSLADALENEAVAQAALSSTQDFGEAMAAFAARREPRFRGS